MNWREIVTFLEQTQWSIVLSCDRTTTAQGRLRSNLYLLCRISRKIARGRKLIFLKRIQKNIDIFNDAIEMGKHTHKIRKYEVGKVLLFYSEMWSSTLLYYDDIRKGSYLKITRITKLMTHNTELTLSYMQENFLRKLLNHIFDSTSFYYCLSMYTFDIDFFLLN